ncbi:MaoC family dehydratase [Sediminitomix flava]|uniref:Acyl dehydratase n=1 Tax=Sediminitomix flava TaxID=379075 RepID=A0A315ZI74_SEDFL|nr:MaoC family dehydratase [Sediminitomix flava]PWJ44518.1 acyl dehydratase [Sediminitomix flava]
MDLHEKFTYSFNITQEQVNQFAELSGDTNPLHLDAEFAAQTQFKKPIIHGIFSASIFSKVLGTQFPGAGSIYAGQEIKFLRPMYPSHPYEARFEIVSIDERRHSAQISTEVYDVETGKATIKGVATVIHKEKF